jgi:hypothetical protein
MIRQVFIDTNGSIFAICLKMTTDIGGFRLGASPESAIPLKVTLKTSGESDEYGFSPASDNCPAAMNEPKTCNSPSVVPTKIALTE